MIFVDSSAWYAVYSRRDVNHAAAARAIRSIREQFDDKNWSFADCTSFVVMQRLGITRAFAFDDHFRQFGKVAVVPSSFGGNKI